MSREETLDREMEFLLQRGAADHSHSVATLIEHLDGTRRLLASWGAPPTLCKAGLFHSVYGTESFDCPVVDLEDRAAVRAVIGPESEAIAYLFAIMSPDSLAENLGPSSAFGVRHRISGEWLEIDQRTFTALCTLSAANFLEQLPRLHPIYREMGRERYTSLCPFLLPAGADAVREVFAD